MSIELVLTVVDNPATDDMESNRPKELANRAGAAVLDFRLADESADIIIAALNRCAERGFAVRVDHLQRSQNSTVSGATKVRDAGCHTDMALFLGRLHPAIRQPASIRDERNVRSTTITPARVLEIANEAEAMMQAAWNLSSFYDSELAMLSSPPCLSQYFPFLVP